MLDILVINSILIDGTGVPSRKTNVGWRGGIIEYIGNEKPDSKSIIDAQEKWLIPGLIDIHTHYDLEVEMSPALSESVRHGVTSVVMGNCSLSLSLGKPSDLADIFHRVESISPSLIRNWLKDAKERNTPQDYINFLKSLKLGPNVALLLGHSALRVFVMGLENALNKNANQSEIEKMGLILEEALKIGFYGLSVDRIPWHLMSGTFAGEKLPSHRASHSEIQYLADICRKYDAILQMTPNPQHRPSIFQLLSLALGVGKKPLRMTVIGALDVDTMPWSWHIWSPLLRFINRWGGANLRLQTLAAPFGIYSDGPVTPLFDEFSTGALLNSVKTREERKALLLDPEFRNAFRHDWFKQKIKTCSRRFNEIKVIKSLKPEWNERYFDSIAEEFGKDSLDFFLDVLAEQDTDFQWWIEFANRREIPRQKLISDPDVQPGLSDAGAHVRNFAYYDVGLRTIRDWLITEGHKFKGRISIEELVARFTGDLAAWWKLPSGTVELGKPADICLIDPEALKKLQSKMVEIDDKFLNGYARFVNRGLEKSLTHVWISGKAVVNTGELNWSILNLGSGEPLRKNPYVRSTQSFAIDEARTLHPFVNYWSVFVLKHQDPRNIFLHFSGVILMTGLPLWAFVAHSWIPLLLWPLSQSIGLIGHKFFEPSPIVSRDAIFSLRATFSLYRMFFELLRGRYFKIVNSSRIEWSKFLMIDTKSATNQFNFQEKDHVVRHQDRSL